MDLNDLIGYMDNDVLNRRMFAGGPGPQWQLYLFGLLVPGDVGGVPTDDAVAVVTDVSITWLSGTPDGDPRTAMFREIRDELTAAGRVCAFRKYQPSISAPGSDVV